LTDLYEFTDKELVDELKRRMVYYKKIDEMNFFFDEEKKILAIRIITEHSTAKHGDFWILNGGYSVSHHNKNTYIIIDGSANPDSIDINFKKFSGRFVKKHHPWTKEYLGPKLKEYYDPGK
jgi:hypothetical protein